MVGEFKDDCLQKHKHGLQMSKSEVESQGWGLQMGGGFVDRPMVYTSIQSYYFNTEFNGARNGDITRGKRKGIKYIIKVL